MRAISVTLAWLCILMQCTWAVAADEKGQSLDQAVILDGVSSEMDGVGAEHAYTAEHYPGWTWQTQALMQNGSRVYDVIDMTGPSGESKSVYFDITDWFGKMP